MRLRGGGGGSRRHGVSLCDIKQTGDLHPTSGAARNTGSGAVMETDPCATVRTVSLFRAPSLSGSGESTGKQPSATTVPLKNRTCGTTSGESGRMHALHCTALRYTALRYTALQWSVLHTHTGRPRCGPPGWTLLRVCAAQGSAALLSSLAHSGNPSTNLAGRRQFIIM